MTYKANHTEGEFGNPKHEFAAFDRLPRAVRDALNDAPYKLSSVSCARKYKRERDMLEAFERTIARLSQSNPVPLPE